MFIKNSDVAFTPCGEGMKRKILGTGGSMMMVEVTFEKGAVGIVHTHVHEQVSYIIKGNFEFEINGEKKVVKEGDSMYIPSNIPHGTVALVENSIILDVFTPQRADFL
ncbi:cupin domain-containing protein [Vallitalea okinawensis]|uniref:cupin domain-containing protein n=1 Tax=Vallitalea okinawensis TaxID=2078660 RepID=UPI000CFE1EAA|nr:cupin domain-containing protein [Vallitalea okinawensis]